MSIQKPSTDKEAPLIEHLKELGLRIRNMLIYLAIFFFIYFAFGISTIKVDSFTLPILYPSIYNSIAIQFTNVFLDREKPSGLHLITLNPFDPLYSSMYVSLLLAIVSAFPLIFREFWAFVAPGLYEHEKRTIRKVLLPATSLFIAGASFAYFIIIPFMMLFVYKLDLSLGVEPTLSLRAYVSTIVTLMIAVGASFEFPLVMTSLTQLGLVKAQTWRQNWRWGVLVSFIIAWIISPGTTGGVIETTIAVTLSSLYFIGVIVSSIIEKRNTKNKNELLVK
ncbi:twin-arginine translocase subunit TatC [Sulfolobus sp. S-194]|uniref:twin-arginine translocase subunit TatC n=1 Tax=Sulfolobus sp. S-194 TaxID=2512240 RepID=UPI001436CD13|nr:twin-arginine translocase subunit TatC [Sulfolobus sp. S-194]QIW23462.1 twin-arginine translocase subunit TatC [Sulfolobus sp. S-194]